MVVSLVITILAMFALVIASEACNVIRDVDVIVEFPPHDHHHLLESIASTEKVKPFYETLVGPPRHGRCWRARFTLVDGSSLNSINSYECYSEICSPFQWSSTGVGRPPRESVAKILNEITLEKGDSMKYSDDFAIIVLVLGNYDLDVNQLKHISQVLADHRFKIITIGVGGGWKEEHLIDIASDTDNIYLEPDMHFLSPTFPYDINERISTLLQNPDLLEMKVDDTDDVLKQFDEDILNEDESILLDGAITCNVSVDLGFVLDVSKSSPSDFKTSKLFIQLIAGAFDVHKEETHTGLVTYSSGAELSIKFDETLDYNTFYNAVENIKQTRGNTRMDLGLMKAKDELFDEKNGARTGKKKILIIITSGRQFYGNTPIAWTKGLLGSIAADIQRKNIEIIVIGIGEKILERELKEIAIDTTNYFHANTWDQLVSQKFTRKMTTEICDKVIATKTCRKIVDVCFLLDSSGSINEETDWVKMKDFVRRLAKVFRISEGGARGSVVVFSDTVTEKNSYTKLTLNLTNKLSAREFWKKIDETPYIGYRTRIDLGFQVIEKEVFTVEDESSINRKKIIILITDGRQNPEMFDPVEASLGLYNKGVNIYAIGIGNNIDFNQLNKITRNPHRVFHAESFYYLENGDFVNSVSDVICDNVAENSCLFSQLDDDVKSSLGKQLVEIVRNEMDSNYSCSCDKSTTTHHEIPIAMDGASLTRRRRAVDILISGNADKRQCCCPDMKETFTPSLGEKLVKAMQEVEVHSCSYEQKECSKVTSVKFKKKEVVSQDVPDENEEPGKLGILHNLSKMVGCSEFLKALQGYGLLDDIKDDKHVSIFCPINSVYKKIQSSELIEYEEKILTNHIAQRRRRCGKVYRTPGGKVLFNSAPDEDSKKVIWKANEVNVLATLSDKYGNEIIVIDNLLFSHKYNIREILKSVNEKKDGGSTSRKLMEDDVNKERKIRKKNKIKSKKQKKNKKSKSHLPSNDDSIKSSKTKKNNNVKPTKTKSEDNLNSKQSKNDNTNPYKTNNDNTNEKRKTKNENTRSNKPNENYVKFYEPSDENLERRKPSKSNNVKTHILKKGNDINSHILRKDTNFESHKPKMKNKDNSVEGNLFDFLNKKVVIG